MYSNYCYFPLSIEHCHGLQVCQAVAKGALFGEPCPGLGSYLSVDYHCKDGQRPFSIFITLLVLICCNKNEVPVNLFR